LELKGDILTLQNRKEAFRVYDTALGVWSKLHPNAPEPPRELLRKHSSLLSEFLIEKNPQP
jgi:hypothetical protein